MPEPVYVTKEGLDRVDTRLTAEIKENSRHIKQNSEAIVKLETLYGTLVKLPDAIASLEKTVVGVNHNLETMSIRIDQINSSVQEQRNSMEKLHEENVAQNKEIEKVDNKSKVDWASFISGNFWNILVKVIVAIASILVVYKMLVP